MFSGIVETTSAVVDSREESGVVRIFIEKPNNFKDLKAGDSIAVNGVCLTLEECGGDRMRFALGPETLKVTGWTHPSVVGRVVNLERSLRLGDRIHGHLVLGHVDDIGRITRIDQQSEGGTRLSVEFPDSLAPFLWPKGSVTINGVSLTLNVVEGNLLQVGLIPETLKRTTLGLLKLGDSVNIEIDNMARGLTHLLKLQKLERQT